MRAFQIILTIFLFTAGLALSAMSAVSDANDEIFIYGKITTTSDKTYTGAIRWGKEEVYWSDMFNSTKTDNEYVDYLSRSQRRELDRGSGNIEIFGLKVVTRNAGGSHDHTFACQFGDIKSMEINGRSRVKLHLKNGESFRLNGGSNDIGATVKILDEEAGLVELEWERIDKVEFMRTPNRLKEKFGEPLFGTVKTFYGDFTGFIQWDHDERVGDDELDGDSEDGDVSIRFENIASIEKKGRGSMVTLDSGRELFVKGSNDVNRENRGIIVTMPGMARVDIQWRDFDSVTFDHAISGPGLAYYDFAAPKYLEGTVTTTDGKSLSGRLVYDLDEAWDFEILQGNIDDLEYNIPFRFIKKIAPKSFNSSLVELRNGEQLRLEGSQDVNQNNDGVLVFENEKDPTWIPWEKIEHVEFK